jgi:hypothetical protein
MVEYVQSLIKTENENTSFPTNNSFSNIPSYKNEVEKSSTAMPNISIQFHTPEKLAANTKRRYENQVMRSDVSFRPIISRSDCF